eukprot:1420289-Pyramimonas_sp.AAC.1
MQRRAAQTAAKRCNAMHAMQIMAQRMAQPIVIKQSWTIMRNLWHNQLAQSMTQPATYGPPKD